MSKGEHKCRLSEKHLKLKDQPTNNTDYTQTAKSHIKVTESQKSTIHTKKGLQTTLKLFIKLQEENQRGSEGKKDLQNKSRTIKKMTTGTSMLLITLKM